MGVSLEAVSVNQAAPSLASLSRPTSASACSHGHGSSCSRFLGAPTAASSLEAAAPVQAERELSGAGMLSPKGRAEYTSECIPAVVW